MKINLLFASLIFATIFSACDPDDNTPPTVNQEELITTVVLTFSPVSGGSTFEFRFTDLDGDGGNAPVIVSDSLMDSTVYNVTAQFLDESVTPADDVTAEIQKEAEEHQVFYLINQGLDLDFSYADSDANGQPLGLLSTFTAVEAGTGTLSVILRHEPNKTGVGVASGDITNAGGETDVEVEFDVKLF